MSLLTKMFEEDDKKTVKQEEPEVETIKVPTSTSDNHSHTTLVDAMGNGSTTTDDGHSHDIEKWVVKEVMGHTHTVDAPEKNEGFEDTAAMVHLVDSLNAIRNFIKEKGNLGSVTQVSNEEPNSYFVTVPAAVADGFEDLLDSLPLDGKMIDKSEEVVERFGSAALVGMFVYKVS